MPLKFGRSPPSTNAICAMNTSAAFDAPNPSNSSSSLPFDFNLNQTVHTHLSNLSDHLYTLKTLHSQTHPLSASQPPVQDNVTSDILTLSASLQSFHATLAQLVQPINGEPILLGAERFVAKLKEHAAFLARLETRKRAVRQVKDEIAKIQTSKGSVRQDLRFTAPRIEALIKELGLLVYADETGSDLSSNTRRLTFGGKLVVIDIDFTTTTPTTLIPPITKITLSIAPADDESISSLGPAAAQVLSTNFDDQDGETFVRNLTNIARWDGCSDPPNEGLNSFAVLKGLGDALELIFAEELKGAGETQVVSRGWGKPERNVRGLVGLSILYARMSRGEETSYYANVGLESRRATYVHPILQTNYLLAGDPFIEDEMNMFPPTSEFLGDRTPNWVEEEYTGDMLIHGASCSFVMDLEPGVVMSVEAAKKVCEIIGYGGWGDVLQGVAKDEWIGEDVMLEDLLFGSMPVEATVEVVVPGEKIEHKYFYVPIQPIPARRVQRIPFSHPRQIFPLLKLLRQWSTFGELLTACFPQNSKDNKCKDLNLEDILNGAWDSVPAISISPLASPPSFIIMFPVDGGHHGVRLSVLENGEIDLDADERLKEQASTLIENVGIGVGIEFLIKEFARN